MMAVKRSYRLVVMGFFAVTISTSPLLAQPPGSDPDTIIDASQSEQHGVALARSQASVGDLLGAAATLERVLIAMPDAVGARLLYASLLCRLDDASGAQVELALLRGRSVDDTAWAEVTAACGTLPRPDEGTE